MKKIISFRVMFVGLILSGCSSADCLNEKVQAANTPTIDTTESKPSKVERVRVYKGDGTLQCGSGVLIAINEMKKGLKDIIVYNEFNKNDGQMRIQVCGSPTGNSNVFEISKQDLDRALKLGFKHWVFD